MKELKMLLDKINIDEKFFLKMTFLSSLIGWWIQTLGILFLSPAYLRFFSISQMISDTIMILIIILLFVYPIKIIYYLAKTWNNNREDIIYFFVFLSIAWLLSWIIWDFQFYTILMYFFQPQNISEWLGWTFYIISIIILLSYLVYVNFLCIKDWLFFASDNKSSMRSFDLIVFTILFIFIPNWLIINVNNTLILPNHFYNIKYICKDLPIDKCKVRYFNDKYIFIERENKNIEILKFDSFFETLWKQ